MSTELKTFDKTTLPAEMQSLPIFQVLGKTIRTEVQKPENKQILAKVFFGAIILLASYWFFTNIGMLAAIAGQTAAFIFWGIMIVVMLLLAPKIISFLHNLGKTILFKSEKELIKRNPIETLQMINNDAKDTLKKVKEKIASVDGVRLNMIADAQRSKDEASAKFNQVVQLTSKAAELDKDANQLASSGQTEKVNAIKREANEVRIAATLRKQEGEASEQTAKQYAQYGNQFSKVLEVLKDNESAAKIYVNALGSSIGIIEKKMEATKKMRSATEGLADVFNVKDSWKFTEAMNAATGAISQNIANIRSNLEFLDENNSVAMTGTATQQELEAFSNQINQGRLMTLNIGEITSADHDLTSEQKVDKSFNLLD